jgi:predicted lipoprotein
MRNLFSLTALALLLSCSDPTSRPTTPPTTQSEAEILADAGQCLQGGYSAFLAAAQALDAAAGELAAAPQDRAKLTAARGAWEKAIDAWQELEPMHIGPAAPATAPGGKGLRDEVYGWPLLSRCTIEQTLVNEGYKSADFVAFSLVNSRGLGAIEYLLFHEGADNACSAQTKINTDGSWAALSAEELRKRKVDYARVAAADVLRRAQELADAWATDKGNFAANLARAGEPGGVFASSQAAFNAMSDALITHTDKETKDRKLGRPLGLSGCTTATCLDELESRYARRSKQHLVANLRGVRKVLRGCTDNGGLEALMRAREAADVAERVSKALDDATKAVEAVTPDDLEAAITQNPEGARTAHAAVKSLTDLLKNEFVLVLGLQLPTLVSGDND